MKTKLALFNRLINQVAPITKKRYGVYYFLAIAMICGRYLNDINVVFGQVAIYFNIYLFSLIFIAISYITHFLVTSNLTKTLITVVTVALFSFPFDIFGISRITISQKNSVFFEPGIAEKKYLSDQIRNQVINVGFPFKTTFLFGLSFIVALVIFKVFKQNSIYRKPLLLGYFFAIFSSWNNFSLGSSYGGLTSFVEKKDEYFFWIVSRFSNHSGLVSGDEFVHRSITNFFQLGYGENLMLIRRPIGYYLASQFSYIFNSYYVWVVINYISWIALMIASLYIYSRFSQKQYGLYLLVLLIGASPLFISYVGQTSPYSLSISSLVCTLALMIFLLEKLPHNNLVPIFSIIAGIQFLIYDSFPWMIAVAIVLYKMGTMSIINVFKAYFYGLLIFFSYLVSVKILVTQKIDGQNQNQIFNNLTGIIQYLQNQDFKAIFQGLNFAAENIFWLQAKILTWPLATLLIFVAVANFLHNDKATRYFARNLVFPFYLVYAIFLLFWSVGYSQYLALLPRMYAPILAITSIWIVVTSTNSSNKYIKYFLLTFIFSGIIYSTLLNFRILPDWQQILFYVNFGRTVTFVQ
jgi:hypothetical protein